MPGSYQTATLEKLLENDDSSDGGYSNLVSLHDTDMDSEPDRELTPDEVARVHRRNEYHSLAFTRMREKDGRVVAFKKCFRRIDTCLNMKETPPANFSDKKKRQHALKYAEAQAFLCDGIKALDLHLSGRGEPREEAGNTQRDAFVEKWLIETGGPSFEPMERTPGSLDFSEADPVRFTDEETMDWYLDHLGQDMSAIPNVSMDIIAHYRKQDLSDLQCNGEAEKALEAYRNEDEKPAEYATPIMGYIRGRPVLIQDIASKTREEREEERRSRQEQEEEEEKREEGEKKYGGERDVD